MQNKNPKSQFLGSAHVLDHFSEYARDVIQNRIWTQNLVLAILGGMFITAGAYFSILLSAGVESEGPALLMLSVGFATGFFFVILSQAILFTEVNVLVPARVLNMTNPSFCLKILAFWGLAIVGNVIGAVLLGLAINIAHPIDGQIMEQLQHLSEKKMSYHASGQTSDWFRLVLSGILANWLVGMAAYFAAMGKTIIGKYVPVLLAVALFVSANFQHSPANTGYFSLIMPTGEGPGWYLAITWNLIPAALGNIIGATLLVALPLQYAFSKRHAMD